VRSQRCGASSRAQWRDSNLPDWQARRRPKPPSPGSTPCPARCRARMPGEYSTRRGRRPCPHEADPVEGPARLFLCVRCHAQVLVCSCCDRGQIYCAGSCAQEARHQAQRAAGRRYQASRRGRMNHAVRSGRWRARQKNVTHQGSPPPLLDDAVAVETAPAANSSPVTSTNNGATSLRSHGQPVWRCHWCGSRCPPFVRLGFLRRRRRSSRNQTWGRAR
jgi:hypothetical protein